MSQKKNRGFTLIELLAVIVILAIIALIAVPVIMNIINKANKSAFKDTAYGVISAGELYFAEHQLEPNGMLEDVIITLPDTTNKLQLKGEVPTGTILITKEGKVAIAVQNGRYCVTKGINDKDVTITENYKVCNIVMPGSLTELATTSTEVTSVPECVTNRTECTAGTPVAIKVNESDVYNFYVIDETENEVTLIMDRNVGKQWPWYINMDTSKGPITILNYLNSQTLTWTNINAIKSYTYVNNLNENSNKQGYQKLEIIDGIGKLTSQDGLIITELNGVMRARLLTYEEAISPGFNCDTIYDLCSTFLYTNLSSDNTLEQPYGYWLLSNFGTNDAYLIHSNGGMRAFNTHTRSNVGLRPVITLTK